MNEKELAELRKHMDKIGTELGVTVALEPTDRFPTDPKRSLRFDVTVIRNSGTQGPLKKSADIRVEGDITAAVEARVRGLAANIAML